MKSIVEFPLENGNTILIEIEEHGPTVRAIRKPGELSERARLTFEKALNKIKPAAEHIIDTIRDMTPPPDEASVEFGVNLNAEVGAFIASVGAEANFKVLLTWRQED